MSNATLIEAINNVKAGTEQIKHITIEEAEKLVGKTFKQAVEDPETLAILQKLGQSVVFTKKNAKDANKMDDRSIPPFTKNEILAAGKVIKDEDGNEIKWITIGESKKGKPAPWIDFKSVQGVDEYLAHPNKPISRKFEIPAIGGINYKGGAQQLVKPSNEVHQIVEYNATSEWHAVEAQYPTTKSKGVATKRDDSKEEMVKRVKELLAEAKAKKDQAMIKKYTGYLTQLGVTK